MFLVRKYTFASHKENAVNEIVCVLVVPDGQFYIGLVANVAGVQAVVPHVGPSFDLHVPIVFLVVIDYVAFQTLNLIFVHLLCFNIRRRSMQIYFFGINNIFTHFE